MKIIHTSDWHLGAKLHDEDRTEEHQAFLDWLVETLKAERPDALVVAGDIFDTSAPSATSMQMFNTFLARAVRDAGCGHIVVTGGNHDSPSWLGVSRPLLKGFGIDVIPAGADDPADECVTIERDGRVALVIAAVPFLRESELTNLVRRDGDTRTHDELVRDGLAEHCRRVVEAACGKASGAPVVMTGHCVLSGSQLSDDSSERMRGIVRDPENDTVGGVKSVAFDSLPRVDYLALGHLHVPQKVMGLDTAQYSGSPIPMSFSEAGTPKRVLAVTLGERNGDPVSVAEIHVPCFRALERLGGTPEDVFKALEGIVKRNGPAYVSVEVTKGEGDLSPWWPKFEGAVAGIENVKIVSERDLRKKAAEGSGLVGLARMNETLATIDVKEIARVRLSEENLTDEERSVFMKMIEEVIAEVDAGAEIDAAK